MAGWSRAVDLTTGIWGERALGFFHIVTGIWLLYLTCAVTLNSAVGTHLPA